jgi:phosphoribosyl-ATP pyrophosphohydrolase
MADKKTDATVIDALIGVIESRRGADPGDSYVGALFAKGTEHIAKKVGEEALETALAALKGERGALISESADLLFHLLVLWVARGITPNDVLAELQHRQGVSGIEEKKSRPR